MYYAISILNTLSVVPIGPFTRKTFHSVADCTRRWLIIRNEARFLPVAISWRLWTTSSKRIADPAALRDWRSDGRD